MTNRRRILARHGRTLLAAGGIAGAALASGFAPPPPGFKGSSDQDTAAYAAIASGALVAVCVVPFLMRRGVTARRAWMLIALVTLALGMASFSSSGYIQRRCTARYFSTPVIIGTELTPLGLEYTRVNPDETRDEILDATQGQADRVWTRSSIARCRVLIASTYYLWIPFLFAALVAAVQAVPSASLPAVVGGAASGVRADANAPPVYDVFISYRHGGRDAEFARQLLDTLENDGYRVAIDERDFPANAAFLEEMERCVRQSRFTVAILSPRYLESGNCQEEAIVCKVLDMGERRRRLIPLMIESVALPAWLYGIVGIDCTKLDPLVDPIEKLKGTIGSPLAQPPRAAV
jgi:TIR domain